MVAAGAHGSDKRSAFDGLAQAAMRPGIIALIFAVALFQLGTRLPGRSTRWDFSIYYLSGRALLQGEDPYTSDFGPPARRLGLEAGDITHAAHPPTFLLCVAPLALLAPKAAYWTWMGLNAACLAAALAILLGPSSGLRANARWALAALALFYYPVTFHFEYSQSNIPILLLLVLMMRCMEVGRDRAAGLCLAFASLLRIFPALLIGYLVLQRRWRVLTYTVAGLAAGGIITLALIGPGNSLAFFNAMRLLTEPQWLNRTANISLSAFISRLFWYALGLNLSAGADFARRAVTLAVELSLAAITAMATWRLKAGRDPDWRAFSTWVALSVMLSPTAWIHYLVLVLIVFAAIARGAAHSAASPRVIGLALASYLVSTVSAELPFFLGGLVASHPSGIWLKIAIEEWRFGSLLLAWLAAYCFTLEAGPDSGDAPNPARLDKRVRC